MTPTPTIQPREHGSAYLLVLLLLLVLTVIGLSLSVVTQTEVQIGGAERTATRNFYSGDSGLRIQLMLSRFRQTRPARFDVDPSTTDFSAQSQVDLSAFLPTFTGPCNLCTVNFGDQAYWMINYVTNAQGFRTATIGGDTVNQGAKLFSAMYFIQPEMERLIDDSIRTYDTETDFDDPETSGLDIIRY